MDCSTYIPGGVIFSSTGIGFGYCLKCGEDRLRHSRELINEGPLTCGHSRYTHRIPDEESRCQPGKNWMVH